MNRRGLTLLELLAALALLSLLAVAAASWLRIAGRGARVAQDQLGSWGGELAALRLLRDDLRLGSPPQLNEAGDELELVTLHGLAGPGRHHVRWQLADGRLLRSEDGAEPRPVLARLPAQRLLHDEAGALWWLLGAEALADVADPEASRCHLVWSAAW